MRSRAAFLSLVAGMGVIAVAQLVAPLRSPPLYDGVVVEDPYRYLAPGPGQAGSPGTFTAAEPVKGTASSEFVAATNENPPQAQLIADPGAFVLAPGSASMTVTIEPVAAPAPPASGPTVGNVYRFSAADQSGAAVPISPTTRPTLLLRDPEGVADAVIDRFADGAWHRLTTVPAGQPGMASTNVDALGDFALIALPTPGVLGPDSRLVGAAAIVAAASVMVLGGLVLRSQSRRSAVPAGSATARPLPLRRKGKRRRRGRSR
jgi:hypothetical protein